ncbi:MAG: Pr6Pr family membrane protein [Sphingobacteriales bacterium]|nr:Pr6Pr family membrane protein [Sphingobacteriales bacterium]
MNRTGSIPAAVIQFFSYFTILTNTLVAVYFTVIWQEPSSNNAKFFLKPQTGTAIAVYITVVGLVYNIILRSTWNPEGLQKMVDELLHSVCPAFFIVYWILAVPKQPLQWKNIFSWLIYPLIYFIYSLLRGAIVDWYPYPFIDVKTIDYTQTFINSGFVLLTFLVLSLLFVGIGKLLVGKNYSKTASEPI